MRKPPRRWTGKASENGQSSVWVCKIHLDQTVGDHPGWLGIGNRYRLGHWPVVSDPRIREGSMYSQAMVKPDTAGSLRHCSAGWAMLSVIRVVWKGPSGKQREPSRVGKGSSSGCNPLCLMTYRKAEGIKCYSRQVLWRQVVHYRVSWPKCICSAWKGAQFLPGSRPLLLHYTSVWSKELKLCLTKNNSTLRG